jgi:K+-sensing histidine kinase KdpD
MGSLADIVENINGDGVPVRERVPDADAASSAGERVMVLIDDQPHAQKNPGAP